MICPNCGTHIPDDVQRCPACHYDLLMTTKLPRLEGTWCSHCGALIPDGMDACPSCGMPVAPSRHMKQEQAAQPVPEAQEEPASAIDQLIPHVEDAPEDAEELGEETLSAEETHAIPRIVSAVPAGPDEGDPTEENDHMPRTRVSIVAAIASLVIVGGSILMIAHPWNAELYSTKATKPADTSMAGYPGEVSSLRGQDSRGSSGSDAQDGRSGDEYSYEQLTDMYKQLGEIEEKLEQSQSDLEGVGLSGDQDERDAKAEEQKAIANDLSNLITDIGETDVSSGTYADTVKNLGTLGSWLRNWSDSLTEAWSRSTASADPASDKDYILSPVSTGEGESLKNSYQQLFDTNYKDWEPEAPQS